MAANNESNKGLIHVYTGPGKGKTTAALGLAMRACGHDWRVLMICFMKGDPNYGEVKISSALSNFELIQSGLPTFVKKGDPSEEDLRLAREGFQRAKDAVADKTLDLLILDEMNVAIDYGLIPLDDVLHLIQSKHDDLELVLTGRYAHPELVKKADLVSEVLEIKHPYQQGIPGREGVDY